MLFPLKLRIGKGHKKGNTIQASSGAGFFGDRIAPLSGNPFL
jgi:hypothetical protein